MLANAAPSIHCEKALADVMFYWQAEREAALKLNQTAVCLEQGWVRDLEACLVRGLEEGRVSDMALCYLVRSIPNSCTTRPRAVPKRGTCGNLSTFRPSS